MSLVNVYSRSSRYVGSVVLDSHEVASINSRLLADDESPDPMRLSENENLAFIGADLRSSGFILDANEYFTLMEQDDNRDCLMPLLGGEEVNTSPTQSNLRYAINFGKRSLEEAMQYPALLDIVRERVKPARDRQKDHGPGKHGKKYWWQYALRSDPLYDAISSLSRCLVTAVTTSHLAFSFQSTKQVFPHSMVVCAIEKYAPFSCLQSSFHAHWALLTSSSLGGTLRYSVSDAFQTFPFPKGYLRNSHLEQVGEAYYGNRSLLMVARQEGLTKTYNRFHDADETSADIQKLRDLHVEMDQAVAAAYGWTDLNLGHDFHETKQGVRFTLSEPARRELLDRLLALNHQRHEEEVAAGLHDKAAKKPTGTGRGRKKKDPAAESSGESEQQKLF